MRYKIIVRTLSLAFAGVSLLALNVVAQEPAAPSVAEAAKRAREQKEQKKDTAKPTPVITNDTLAPSPSTSPTNPPAGPESPPADAGDKSASGAAAGAAKNSATDAAEEAKRKEQLEALKKLIAEKQREVDLAQRELALEQDTYFSKPTYTADKNGKAKIDADQADINEKKAQLASLRAEFGALGGVEDAKPAPGTTPAPEKP